MPLERALLLEIGVVWRRIRRPAKDSEIKGELRPRAGDGGYRWGSRRKGMRKSLGPGAWRGAKSAGSAKSDEAPNFGEGQRTAIPAADLFAGSTALLLLASKRYQTTRRIKFSSNLLGHSVWSLPTSQWLLPLQPSSDSSALMLANRWATRVQASGMSLDHFLTYDPRLTVIVQLCNCDIGRCTEYCSCLHAYRLFVS